MAEPPVPTTYTVDRRQIVRATGGAFAVATLVFLVAVLPAEYGLDPTGVGSALGLVQLGESKTAGGGGAGGPGAAYDPVRSYGTAPRTINETITLDPGAGIEFKVRMEQGEAFLYRWNATGDVFFDLHGEPEGAAPGVFTSYLVSTEPGDAGSLTAPFLGTHGWYFENVGDVAVTITLTVEGYFEPVGESEPTR